MKGLRNFFRLLVVVVILVGAAVFLLKNYKWIFSQTIQGEIIEIEHITHSGAVLNGTSTQIERDSYSLLIQNKDKTFLTKAVDTQWGVAKKGYCVIATLYRYPPWDMENGGTFYDARLRQVYRCPGKKDDKTAQPTAEPSLEEAPPEEPAL